MKEKGSIALEGCVALSILSLLVPFLVDGVKRSQYQCVFHCAAFRFARFRALGISQSTAKQRAKRFLERVFSVRGFDIEETRSVNGLWGHVHLRFEMSQPFRMAGGARHHLEVTERCLFPF